MAITKRTNRAGKFTGYTVQVSIPNPNGGRGTRHTVGTFTLRNDAERAERDAKVAIENGPFTVAPTAPARVWTVADVASGWLAGRKAHVTSNTWAGYDGVWRLHLKDALADRDVTTLTRADIKALVRGWQEAGNGAQLQNRSLLVLRCALDEAVEDGILAANPASRLKLPSPKSRRDLPVWTPAHLRAFLAEAERDLFGVFWHLTALEGMRRAEALGLRRGDLHWTDDESGCTATVVQTVVPDLANGGAPLVQPRRVRRHAEDAQEGAQGADVAVLVAPDEAVGVEAPQQQFLPRRIPSRRLRSEEGPPACVQPHRAGRASTIRISSVMPGAAPCTGPAFG